MNAPQISVIICSHNPRPYVFQRVLDALRAQDLPQTDWELLVVDNASTEPLAKTWDLSWHPQGRHVLESTLGLTPARLRGIREARGELLVFVDDDNILAPDFLKRAWTISREFPLLGVIGAGVLQPEYEVPPPAAMQPRLHMLAIRTVPNVMWSNNARDHTCIPWGAGLCVTRQVGALYLKLVDQMRVTVVLDRRGETLFSGGDDLFSWAAARVGLGFGLFPELKVTHVIYATRIKEDYLVRLVHDQTFSHGVLRYLLTGLRQSPPNPLRYPRLLLHGLKNGAFSMRCHWAEMRGLAGASRFITERKLDPLAA